MENPQDAHAALDGLKSKKFSRALTSTSWKVPKVPVGPENAVTARLLKTPHS